MKVIILLTLLGHFNLKNKSCFVYYANKHKEKYKNIQTRTTCMSLGWSLACQNMWTLNEIIKVKNFKHMADVSDSVFFN